MPRPARAPSPTSGFSPCSARSRPRAESPAVAKASNLKVLAALAKTRIAALPDIPTMAELGFPAEAFTAGGIIVPAKTPDAVVARLEKACPAAVASDGYKNAADKLNAVARYLGEKEFRAMFEQDSVRNAEAVTKAES